MKTPTLRAIQGVALAWGAPVGWLGIQFLNGVNPLQDLLTHPGIYIYMLVGTSVVFALFGYYSGTHEAIFESRSEHDGLTGLYNARYFWKRLREDLAAAQRMGFPLSVMSIDLDHFKRVNDSYGHATGDRVLKAIAQALEDNKRESDVVARVGGEEFGVILPFTGREDALEAAGRLHRAIASLSVDASPHPPIFMTASIGIASCLSRQSIRPEALFEQADRSMYAAKQAGRNRIVVDQGSLSAR